MRPLCPAPTMMPSKRVPFMLLLLLPLRAGSVSCCPDLCAQSRQDIVQVTDRAEVRNPEYRRLRILVDRHEHSGLVHVTYLPDRSQGSKRGVTPACDPFFIRVCSRKACGPPPFPLASPPPPRLLPPTS